MIAEPLSSIVRMPAPLPFGREDRARVLRQLGAAEAQLDELLAYGENPYRGSIPEDAVPPAVEDRHVSVWREWAAEAAQAGPGGGEGVLRRHLVQLRFPIRAGISSEPEYRAATRRGVAPDGSDGLAFENPGDITITVADTVAGAIPVVTATAREDFVRLVQALTGRNEPVDVPPAMGACLVKGLINWHRVARHRERWAAEAAAQGLPSDETAWPEEMARLSTDRDAYQDRLLLLSSGPYSAVGAEEMGLDEAAWRNESVAIRREHEAFHYLTLRVCGTIRSNLLDELLADLAGLLRAQGSYRAEAAQRFLGVDTLPTLRADARLLAYIGEPPLSAAALPVLARLAVAATRNLETVVGQNPLSDPRDRAALLLGLARGTLEELADREAMNKRWNASNRGWSCRAVSESEVGQCLASFDAFAREVGMTEMARRDAAIVLDEVLSNAVRYGLAAAVGPLRAEGAVSATIERSGTSWEIRIADPGPAFNPVEAPPPAVERPLDERVPGGIGLELVRRLASRLDYERRDGENHLAVRLRD
jgi:anti-sigma regulatory factor (Ser/Thr protein kinase)